MKKMLIADDNRQITSILDEYAKIEGYETSLAFDGLEAINRFLTDKPDVILLDVMMPKKTGFEVCREIRKVSNVPILMITCRSEDFDKIMGLEIGADDYIVKPASPEEIMARVRVIMRRIERPGNNSGTFEYDGLKTYMDEYKVSIDSKNVRLTKKEFELLWVLATNRKKVFSRDNLLDSLWGQDYYGDNRIVDKHISRLRSKIEECGEMRFTLKTIRGVGYKFEVVE